MPGSNRGTPGVARRDSPARPPKGGSAGVPLAAPSNGADRFSPPYTSPLLVLAGRSVKWRLQGFKGREWAETNPGANPIEPEVAAAVEGMETQALPVGRGGVAP